MGSLDFSFVTIAAIPVTGTPGGPSIAPVVVVETARRNLHYWTNENDDERRRPRRVVPTTGRADVTSSSPLQRW